ncbi:MAG: hypothetical protein U5L09_16750 [Bacteroidales bacterium]|nr:hypothetical protein [Bacteroidales bacterium]
MKWHIEQSTSWIFSPSLCGNAWGLKPAWQSMQASSWCLDVLNFSSSTCKETSLPVSFKGKILHGMATHTFIVILRKRLVAKQINTAKDDKKNRLFIHKFKN